MILDAGPLITADRDRRAFAAIVQAALENDSTLRTTEAIVAQVWRSSRQANLASALAAIEIHPEFGNGRHVGELLGATETSDPIDAHLAILARRMAEPILTADITDFKKLAEHAEVRIVPWNTPS